MAAPLGLSPERFRFFEIPQAATRPASFSSTISSVASADSPATKATPDVFEANDDETITAASSDVMALAGLSSSSLQAMANANKQSANHPFIFLMCVIRHWG